MANRACILVVLITLCKALPAQSQKAADELAKFRSKSSQQIVEQYLETPPYDLMAIQRLIELNDPSVRPALRIAFLRERESITKLYLAAALVSLRDPEPQFFNYVLQAATDAVNNDMPFPMPGRKEDSSFREEFEKWKASKSPEQLKISMAKRLYSDAGAVRALAESNDARSVPVLQKGLLSPNFLVVQISALGLARIQDQSVIPLIISACQRLSPEAAKLTAKALAYFNTVESRAALARFIPNESERQAILIRAVGSGPQGAVFEY